VKLKDGGFTKYTTKDGLPHKVIRSLFEDRIGALWIGTDQGLARLKDGVFTAHAEREGFIGNQVRAIYEDGDGVLWIGTYDGGLYRFKDERLTRYTTKEGLHDNGVFQILEDDAGNLWMGCNRGIYRVSRRELNEFAEGRSRSITSVVYGVKDGLATLECNGGRQPSGLKTADGKLWFPTMGGVAVIDPKALQLNIQPPPVIIEEFRLDNETLDFRHGALIPPNKDSFEIRYTAPSFIKPEYIKFKYKLEGLDKDWVDAGARRVVNYNYVPPGDYTFTVIAANSDGVWNQTGQSIHLEVIPHWWEIRWAQVLICFVVLLVFAAGGFFVHRRRTAQLKKEKAMQEDFSKQLIDSQENERERVARELHDGLSQDLANIKSRAQLVLIEPDNPSMLQEQLDNIVAEATQAIDETKEIAYNLRPYQLDRLGLTGSIEEMVKKISDSRKHKLTFHTRIDDIDGIFPKDAELNIYRIIQESVNNLVKHSEATEAEVIIKNNLSGVEIAVKDNGKGFTIKSSESNEPVERGFGLVSITERTRILGGKLTVQSKKGEGTTITAKLELEDRLYEQENPNSYRR
jgi:signal transduction histidine kinase